MDAKPRILVVDDDAGHLSTLETIIRSWGYPVDGAVDGETAVTAVKKTPYDLVITDVRMAAMSGIEALTRIKAYNPSLPVLIMTAYSSIDSAVEAMKAGAYDYLTKPLDFDELKLVIERALEHLRLKTENRDLKRKLYSRAIIDDIIGASPAFKKLIEMLAMVAPSEATVLITGESGTGKELMARAIHANSGRADGPLITVNCAALVESLIESELFGHEKGAFTGAEKKRDGRFMQADKGTIFLDEIGELSKVMQAKLLRVIQEGEIQRVGGDRTLKVDVRILAATNRNLEKEVKAGKFREDLFYRLNVVNLAIPPLRERVEDIPLLAQRFLNIFKEKNRKKIKGFTPGAMDILLKYGWPGNVRELENAVERAVILALDEFIGEKELPLNLAVGKEAQSVKEMASPALGGSLEEMEKEAIISTLRAVAGNKSVAARKLGLTRRTLYNKLHKYGLDQ
ncbi:MAG: sigma-54-dependent Fis family transcriptional regulator [Deltaproteobacteria bacterium]|nr:sigma-54-dependent Fis family transcriptional regulator [Deltaproteobacteria bacterium]